MKWDWEGRMGSLNSQQKRDQPWKRWDVHWTQGYRVRHPCAGFAYKRSHRLVLCPIGKVSFIRPPHTGRSLSSSQYPWLGSVLFLLTYSKWRVNIHESSISFPLPELQALPGGRGGVRKGRQPPQQLLEVGTFSRGSSGQTQGLLEPFAATACSHC